MSPPPPVAVIIKLPEGLSKTVIFDPAVIPVTIPVKFCPDIAGNVAGNLASGIVPDPKLDAFSEVRLAPLPSLRRSVPVLAGSFTVILPPKSPCSGA